MVPAPLPRYRAGFCGAAGAPTGAVAGAAAGTGPAVSVGAVTGVDPAPAGEGPAVGAAAVTGADPCPTAGGDPGEGDEPVLALVVVPLIFARCFDPIV